MKGYFSGLIYLWILLAVPLAVSPAAAPQEDGSPSKVSKWADRLPNGEARETVVSRCQICHSLERVVTYRRSKEEWSGVVGAMIARGAPVSRNEMPSVVDYLAESFGLMGTSRLTSVSVNSDGQGSSDETKFHGALRLYVSNQDGASIDVIDPVTNKVAQTIRGLTSPDGVVSSLDGGMLFISDRIEHVVVVVDTRTARIIKKIPVTDRPQFPVISNDGKKVYVGIWPLRADDARRGFIDVIDTTSLQKIKTIPTKGGIHDMVVTPDGRYLVAGSQMGKFLSVYDLETDELAWDLQFDKGVETIVAEAGPNGSTSRVFFNLADNPGFAVVDFAERKEVARIMFPTDGSPSEGKADSHGMVIAPDGKSLWTGGNGYKTPYFGNVYVYSLPELKPLGHVHISNVDESGKPAERGGGGHWQAFSPDGKIDYVISDYASVSAVDVKTMKEVTRIPVGENPRHILALLVH
jgi:YVTN family beta-propeller protein